MAPFTKSPYFVVFVFQSLILFEIAFASHPCQHGPEKFLTEPADITTYEGNWVNFTCSIREYPSNVVKLLKWHIDPYNEEARDYLHHIERDGIITGTLTIRATGRLDYFITCNLNHVTSISHQRQDNCFSSRRATLTVHYFPKRSELRCSPNKSTELREGDIVDLKCSVIRSKPAVDLRWITGDLNVMLLPMVKDVGRVRYLTSKLLISTELHLKYIKCAVTSKIVFPQKALNCSIGPLMVIHPPRVNVYPMYLSLKPGHSASVFCEAFGYPSIFEFLWACQPDYLFNGCDSMDNNVNLSLACQKPKYPCEEETNATISCTAFNMAGNATGTSNLTIQRPPKVSKMEYHKPAPTECESKVYVNITANINKNMKQIPVEVTIYCTVFDADADSHVLWLFDEIPIKSTNQKFRIMKLWKSFHSLQILNPSQEDNGKEVSCRVTACNTTQTSSIVLSFDDRSLSSESPPSNAPKPHQMLMWRMVAVAVLIVVLAIILTAFLVAVILTRVYRRSGTINNHSTTAASDHNRQDVDQSSLSSNTHSFGDATYEIPSVNVVPNFVTLSDSCHFDTIPHYHDYNLKYPYESKEDHGFDLSSSSHSSWTSCSDGIISSQDMT